MSEETTTAPETDEKVDSGTPAWMAGEGLGEADMTGDARAGGANLRYWMKKNTERKIIFLTEGNRAPVIWEHQVRLGGKWTNWFTCLQPTGIECPLCNYADDNDGAYRRTKVMYFTIIDTHEFTDKSGKKRKNLKKLFGAKKDTTEVLKRQYLKRIEAEEGLKFAMYEVFRTNSDTSASVGEQFEFVKMIDASAIDDTDELDYAELLAPNPEAVANAVARLKREKGGGSDAESKPEGTDSKVEY